jgi:hypothetical protein
MGFSQGKRIKSGKTFVKLLMAFRVANTQLFWISKNI